MVVTERIVTWLIWSTLLQSHFGAGLEKNVRNMKQKGAHCKI